MNPQELKPNKYRFWTSKLHNSLNSKTLTKLKYPTATNSLKGRTHCLSLRWATKSLRWWWSKLCKINKLWQPMPSDFHTIKDMFKTNFHSFLFRSQILKVILLDLLRRTITVKQLKVSRQCIRHLRNLIQRQIGSIHQCWAVNSLQTQ